LEVSPGENTMEWTIPCDGFSCFSLLSFGLLFVAALWTRGSSPPPTGVVERRADRPPARPDRIADRVPGRLAQTGPDRGPPPDRQSEVPDLEAYARQFEEAIEKIRRRRQDLTRGK
jgi:hypothetical protein